MNHAGKITHFKVDPLEDIYQTNVKESQTFGMVLKGKLLSTIGVNSRSTVASSRNNMWGKRGVQKVFHMIFDHD